MIYTPLTKKALKICFEAHKNQTDKSGIPYVFHAFHLAEQMDDEISVCVALLHDVAEDTSITLRDLRAQGFPDEVISALALLTHDKTTPYMIYVENIRMNPVAKKVKLADLRHNSDLSRLDAVTPKDLQRVEKYARAIKLLDETGNPLLDMLNDTLTVLHRGYYIKNGRKIDLLPVEELRRAEVYLPDNANKKAPKKPNPRCRFLCENIDSFSMARSIAAGSDGRVTVLNFANPVNPGGGVRKGARAQEEDLCRKSSLLLSLESDFGRSYYEYNRSLKTYMGSDAVLFSPEVCIIRDNSGELADYPLRISVLTCAAPMLRFGTEGMSGLEYRSMLFRRMITMFREAERQGSRQIVLGAWGCGAFQNDAAVVAELFRQALDWYCPFDVVAFAVLDRSADKYNYNAFARYFG